MLAKMLDGLPDRFSAVITAWGIVPEEAQTRATLKRMLFETEARSTSVADAEQALTTSIKPGKKSMVKSKKDATTPGKEKEKEKRKKNIECFKCHKKGHYARECRSNQSKKDADVSITETSGPSCFSVETYKDSTNSWIADSGASCHMANDRSLFTEYNSRESILSLAGESALKAVGIGTVPIKKYVNGRWELAYFLDVLYVPGLRRNLFSIGAAARRGVTSYVGNGQMKFERDGRLELKAIQGDNNLFTMAMRRPVTIQANKAVDLKTWHDRLGHISLKTMREMVSAGIVLGLKIDTNAQLFCESCIYGKMSKLPFSRREERSFAAGEMWHSDVNTMPKESWGGNRYYVIFVDDKTGFRFVYFMKHKDEVLKNFINLIKRVKTATGRNIKVLRSDNGGEYRNAKFKDIVAANGIDHQFSAPRTPEQNGVAERDNRTVVERARSMLEAKKMPMEAWAEAVSCAIYLLNRTPCCKTPGSSPCEEYFGRKPDLSYVRKFGSVAYELVGTGRRNKLQPKAYKRILVGYDSESSNYRLLDWTTKRITISRHVRFDESRDPLSADQDQKWRTEVLDGANGEQEALEQPEPVTSDEEDKYEEARELPKQTASNQENQRKLRDRASLRPPNFYQAHCAELGEPQTYEEAMESSEAKQWQWAIREEELALLKNNTWIKATLPADRKVITAKILFKKKRGADGKVNRYKARLVVRGFSQRPGIDYNETCTSHTVRINSLITFNSC